MIMLNIDCGKVASRECDTHVSPLLVYTYPLPSGVIARSSVTFLSVSKVTGVIEAKLGLSVSRNPVHHVSPV